jgi:hypothetical protein
LSAPGAATEKFQPPFRVAGLRHGEALERARRVHDVPRGVELEGEVRDEPVSSKLS